LWKKYRKISAKMLSALKYAKLCVENNFMVLTDHSSKHDVGFNP